MRHAVSVFLATIILVGAYLITFGMPAALAVYLDDPAGSSAAENPVRADQPGGEPMGRPGGINATAVVLAPVETRSYFDVLHAVGSADAVHSADVIPTVSGRGWRSAGKTR